MSMHKKPLTKLEHDGLLAHGLDIGTPSQLSDVFRQGIAFALANAPTVQREGWVSVEDRFPKDYQYVIALEDDGEIYKLMFTANQEGTFWRDIQGYYYHNVTHWQPLPAAPKE